MMKSSIEQIGPEQAKIYLKVGGSNPRKYRPAYAKQLARAMLAGEFKETHQGIAFDDRGNLQDGQHRLNAIILSGVTLTMMVTLNVPAENFSNVDSGMNRSIADRLGTSPSLIALANAHFYFTRETFDKPTQGDIKRIVDLFMPFHEKLNKVTSKTKRKYSVANIRYAVAVNMMASTWREEYALEQYSALINNDFKGSSSGIDALRKIIEDGRSSWHARISKADLVLEQAPIAYRAFDKNYWNAKVIGKLNKEKVKEEMRMIIQNFSKGNLIP